MIARLPRTALLLCALCTVTASLAAAKPLPNFNAQNDAYDAATQASHQPSKSLAQVQALAKSSGLRLENLHIDERLGLTNLITFPANSALRAKAAGTKSPELAARAHLQQIAELYGLTAADVDAAKLDYVEPMFNGAVLAKFDNQADGIEVFRESVTVLMNTRLDALAIRSQIGPTQALLASAKAVRAHAGAASLFKISMPAAIAVALGDYGISASLSKNLQVAFGAGNPGDGSHFYAIAPSQSAALDNQMLEPARIKNVWFRLAQQLIPSYYIEIQMPADSEGAPRFYSYVISADDGRLLFRNNLTAELAYSYRVWAEAGGNNQPYPGPQGRNGAPHPTGFNDGYQGAFVSMNDITLQNGPISTNDPWLEPGATQTIGNNVEAWANVYAPLPVPPATVAPADGFEVAQNECSPIASDFRDFHACASGTNAFLHTYNPLLGAKASKTQAIASVVNLFYVNNWLHDWYYDSGFKEIHGNAQSNNYGRGGLGNDSIRAQAQDNAGLNNAYMSTPSDGARPRMQMLIYTGQGGSAVLVGANLARAANAAVFGPRSFNANAPMVVANDSVGVTTDACQPLSSVAGAIVLIDRGTCTFKSKVLAAQTAGALGVIVINNVAGTVGSMGEDATISAAITIPSLIVSQTDGAAIRALVPGSVPAQLVRLDAVDRDGTIDNMIVAHEWGHYISSRLIGNANGLSTNLAAGLGEGWADFHALILQAKAEDALLASNANFTGVYSDGAYAQDGPQIAGLTASTAFYSGSRRYPYSSDLSKNPLTYKHIQTGVALPATPSPAFSNNNAESHNTGEVWASMLWGCYSNLLRDTPRLSFAQAQERMKRYLVASYKLTPNDPTLLEARDALFAAIGANDAADLSACKAAFAQRGAGVFARSGPRNSSSNAEIVESFVAQVPANYAGNVQFTLFTQNSIEGTSITVAVSRTDGFVGAVSVNYATSDASARAALDFISTNGTLSWADGDSSTKSFSIPIISDTTPETPESFEVTLSNPLNGNLGAFKQVISVVDAGVFPANCALPSGWNKPANAANGWIIASDSTFSGACSFKSSAIADNAKAQIEFSGNFVAGEVAFARRVSSEAGFDCLRFLIDGAQQPYADNCKGTGARGESGTVAWGMVSVPITAGTHTLTWSYEKDASASRDADAAWIDAVSLPLLRTAPAYDYSDMWWAGGSENGWGVSIQQHGNGVQVNALYVYDNAGVPRWYVMSGGNWSNDFSTFTGPLYQPTGAPLNRFNTNQIVVGASVGTLTVDFSSSDTATLKYTINGISGSKQISRQRFGGSGAAPLSVGDLWWGGVAENGWGINIAQQQDALFAVWYTYGADGKAQWLVMSGGGWNGNTYSAPLYATTGSPWLGSNYNPSALTVLQVGTMSISFSSPNAATMNYAFTAGPFAGTSQSKTIERQPY
jgi:hypothetical protein